MNTPLPWRNYLAMIITMVISLILVSVLGYLYGSTAFVIALTAIITAFVGIMLSQKSKYTQRLAALNASLEHMSSDESDINYRIDASQYDELGSVASGINKYADSVAGTISELVAAVDSLTTISDKLLDLIKINANNITSQDAQVEEAASSINALETSSQGVTENAINASETTSATRETVKKGEDMVIQNMDSTNQLAGFVNQTADALNQLQQDSERITGVLDVIQGIAEQTNLLALNAAIEAARAGEQGRGFAVVADEVRTLAARTQESTTEIQEMTERLRSATLLCVDVMGSSQEQVSESVNLSQQAKESLAEVSQSIKSLAEMNTKIASVSQDQSSVIEDINDTVDDISTISSINALHANETADHVKELNEIVSNLSVIASKVNLHKSTADEQADGDELLED